ncbi:hypothetical protein T484DRAFT_1817296 [Baffinella frigidus]|nr:hypothetical protein T484DRAFT_1817296 [Cryptophyta sp. CCMP2293]
MARSEGGGMSLPSSSSMVRPHHRLHGRSGRVVAAGSAFAALLLVAVVLQGKGSGSGHGRSELLSEVGTVWADPWSLNPGSAVSKAAAVAASDMVMAHTMAKGARERGARVLTSSPRRWQAPVKTKIALLPEAFFHPLNPEFVSRAATDIAHSITTEHAQRDLAAAERASGASSSKDAGRAQRESRREEDRGGGRREGGRAGEERSRSRREDRREEDRREERRDERRDAAYALFREKKERALGAARGEDTVARGKEENRDALRETVARGTDQRRDADHADHAEHGARAVGGDAGAVRGKVLLGERLPVGKVLTFEGKFPQEPSLPRRTTANGLALGYCLPLASVLISEKDF